MQIALTGITGFLGGHVATALQKQGLDIRAMVRNPEQTALFSDKNIQFVHGDLHCPDALDELVHECDALIHIAGAIKAWKLEGFLKANQLGTRNLVEACSRKAPNCRMVHVSSIAAREPDLSAYACSKAKSEQEAMAHSGQVCVLRPNAVYGPKDKETLQVFKLAQLPVQPLFDLPDSRLAMIHVHDVTQAILCMIQPSASTGIYEISDARLNGYEWSEIVRLAVEAVGGKLRTVSIPSGILPIAGVISELVGKLGNSPPIFNSGKVREMMHPDWSVDPARQIPTNEWQPEIEISDGFSQTVAWYQENGWLKSQE